MQKSYFDTFKRTSNEFEITFFVITQSQKSTLHDIKIIKIDEMENLTLGHL
jgi:hypothetical protein